jgi:hypothetical protein
MALKKITEEGVTYYEVYMCCPVCNSRGIFTEQSYWLHHNCGGSMFVGSNALYKCTKCGGSSHVTKWKYICPTHSGRQGRFMTVAGTGTPVCLIPPVPSNEVSIEWLQEYLRNLGEV